MRQTDNLVPPAHSPLAGLAHRALLSYIRHFPIAKGKDRILARLWRPLSFGNFVRHTTLRDAPVRVRCDVTKFIQRQLYFYGSYETEQSRCWMKLARKCQIIFDVGANVGLYSLLAASQNANAEIHAFEPTPEVGAIFTENIRLNGYNNIQVNPMGVSDANGAAFLRRCAGSDGSNEGMNFVIGGNAGAGDEKIDVISIDDYSRLKQIDHIDLMKLDIEGGEYSALVGARRLLGEKKIDWIFLELVEWAAQRSGHSTIEIKHLLADFGYHLYRIHGDSLQTISWQNTNDGDNVVASVFEPAAIQKELNVRA